MAVHGYKTGGRLTECDQTRCGTTNVHALCCGKELQHHFAYWTIQVRIAVALNGVHILVTTMVTLSVKTVIDSNRSLLVRNIIPCQEFYDNISRLNVFPDTMLKDIKVLSFISLCMSYCHDTCCIRVLSKCL